MAFGPKVLCIYGVSWVIILCSYSGYSLLKITSSINISSSLGKLESLHPPVSNYNYIIIQA